MFSLHHSVGVSLSDIKQEFDDKGLVNRDHILIADGETGINLEQALCYKLWEDGVSLKGRNKD